MGFSIENKVGVGYNFFEWCSYELNDEKDLMIFRQKRKIVKVESSLKETKNWLKSFIASVVFLY